MNSQNQKVIYIWSACIGGIGGLIFLFCFLFILGSPNLLSDQAIVKLNNFISFVSKPVFYLIGDKIGFISFIFSTSIFILYWEILGMAVSCSLVWLYFLIFRKRQPTTNSSLHEK